MICNKCGTNIPDGAAFCPQCGAKEPGAAQPVQAQPMQEQPMQEQPVQPAQGAPKANPLGGVMAKIKDNKALKLGIIGGAALIVIIIIIAVIAANAGGGSAYGILQNEYMRYYIDGESTYFYNGKQLSKTIDGSSGMIMCADNSAFCTVNDGTLYYCKGTDLKSVADDVSNAYISADGSTVAYISDNVISVYNGTSKKVAELDDNESLSSLSISPDGSAIAYCVYSDGKYKAYGWKGAKAVKIGNYMGGTVSNGGSVFYGVTDKYKLYIVKNFDESTKDMLGETTGSFAEFTPDRRGILFSSNGKYHAYDPSFKEDKAFSADGMYLVTPYYPIQLLPSLKSFVIYSDSKLIRVSLKGGEYDKTVLARNVYSYRLSADGKTIIYLKNDTLYRASALKETAEPERLAENIRSFDANSSLSAIFCTNYDDELVYIKGKGKTEKVESDIPDSFTVLENGTCLYTMDDEYRYSTGGKGKRCDGIGEADYYSNGQYHANKNTVYAYSDGYIYVSTDGRKFTKTKVEYDY